MASDCHNTSCEVRKICGELQKIGCGQESSWLGLLLFVRNLIRQFTIFSDERKQNVQQFVFAELAKRDPSRAHLQHVLETLEFFLTEHLPMASLREQLDVETAASRALAESVGAFLQDSLASEQERGRLVGRFGRETMEALAGGEEPGVMIPRLQGLVTDMLVHYREQAQAWENKALQLEKAIRVDPLLAPLHNRRALDDHLGEVIARAGATGAPLSVLMIDVDNFKTTINDVYGHSVGDDVLRTLAKIIDAHAGKYGWFAARYGGDELLLVCDVDAGEARLHADAIRLAVQHYEFRPRIEGRLAETPIHFTVSIGVAAYRPGMTSGELVDAADKAMYQVKGSGRNNVAAYEPPA